jgi:nucleotide-binding universal stress UspA family protein
MKVLLPVDGSEHSLNAVKYVVRLAKENGPVAIRLLNVYQEPVHLGDVGLALTREQLDEVQRKHCDPALAASERLLREAGVPFERETSVGQVPVAIVLRAQDAGCDAIVMGTRGAGALPNLLMGSVAWKVVQLSKVPVTLVK